MRSKPPIFERFIIADCLYHQVLNDEESTAFDQLKAEARNRNPWAVTRLAQLAIEGRSMYYDVKNSVEHGIQMLLPLAERGFAFAQYRLAEAYLMLDQEAKAIDLLEKCLKARIPDAAHRLALLYEHQNPKRAEKCLKLAEKWGFNEAEFVESARGKAISNNNTASSNLPITDTNFDREIDSDYVERKSVLWLNRNRWESTSDVQVYKSRSSNGQ
ncbi:sel1 repeat family protein [Paenibacillus thalictri]|uniref:Sel1 repeat family protein n=1 Tax=Paenibacillus thalictri TaxID=2527873 RepID=A0A4Q9DYE1_9BACL|nr:sel1 repeat family protein [Paenibacillus thalictri]TBL80878.1 sel1 repeat family protein [Paenibacillus thalictri]